MNANLAAQSGSFTVFGFAKSPARLAQWAGRLGITPRTVDFGDWGRFFFFSSYGDIEETEQVLALKLGFVRSPSGTPLSTRELVRQKIADPQVIQHRALRGNALVACLSKTEASFSVYQTLLSAYQLHYAASDDGILCSDSLRCLVAALDHVEVDEDLIPWHFALMYIPGRLTFFRNIQRLFPGELLRWKEGKVDVHIAQDLRFADNGPEFDRADDRTTAFVHRRLGEVLRAYMDEAEKSGKGGVGTFLSGGIDSSLLQLIVNEQSSQEPRSFTYAPTRAPNFEFEIENARRASQVFGTQHTFVEIAPEDFPELLTRATDILAQPVITDPEVNKLGLAEYLAQNVDDLQFFVNGLAAGTLFGSAQAQRVKQLEILAKIPMSQYALRATGMLLQPFVPRAQSLLKAADLLAQADDPDSFITRINIIGTHAQFDLPRRFFGDEAVLRALRYRQDLGAQYLGSHHPMEKAYVISLITHVYEVQVQSQRLFLSQNKEQIYPFTDEDIIRLAFAFHPDVRYLAHSTYKYPFRRILAQRSSSTVGVGQKRKGGSLVFADLLTWMQSGPLQEMVRDIELPGFLSRKEFEDLIQHPCWFLWSLLSWDVFRKRILKRGSATLLAGGTSQHVQVEGGER